VLTPPCSLDRLIRPWTRYYTGAGKARHGSVCFEATSFFSFWRKSLIIGLDRKRNNNFTEIPENFTRKLVKSDKKKKKEKKIIDQESYHVLLAYR